MDTEEEDILAIYINLINMINAFTKLQMDLFYTKLLQEKKKLYEIFCFCSQMTNTKLLKESRLLKSIG